MKHDDEASPVQELVMRLLPLMAKHDATDELMWDENLNFSIVCNDTFWWGTADAESITPETLEVLEQAFEDGGDHGTILYCSRIRKMRPQGAVYKYLHKEIWPLFDACGPEREIDSGNPKRPGDA